MFDVFVPTSADSLLFLDKWFVQISSEFISLCTPLDSHEDFEIESNGWHGYSHHL